MAGFDLSGMSGAPSFTGGAGGQAGASLSSHAAFDNSGWTVNVGGGSAGTALSPMVMLGLAVGALVLWKMSRK